MSRNFKLYLFELAVRDGAVLSGLILGGLVGLRPYEVLRLEWTGIHFQTCEIRVETGWTKTHPARVIPLQPNALEWLKLIAVHTAEKTGNVMPSASTSNNRWRRWRQEADTPLPLPWWVGKDDVLRHSYATYRAAILRNSHNLAEEMGNFLAIVRTYYDAVVSPPWPNSGGRSDRTDQKALCKGRAPPNAQSHSTHQRLQIFVLVERER